MVGNTTDEVDVRQRKVDENSAQVCPTLKRSPKPRWRSFPSMHSRKEHKLITCRTTNRRALRNTNQTPSCQAAGKMTRGFDYSLNRGAHQPCCWSKCRGCAALRRENKRCNSKSFSFQSRGRDWWKFQDKSSTNVLHETRGRNERVPGNADEGIREGNVVTEQIAVKWH